jgi:hypothetical protein
MNNVIEEGSTFRTRTLAARDGETKGLQSGDNIFFKLTRSGSLETYGFLRKGMPIYFTGDDGKGDDKCLSLWLIGLSLREVDLEMAALELAELIGTVCNLPYLRRVQNGNYIMWEFHREEPTG